MNRIYKGKYYEWIECGACYRWHQTHVPCLGIVDSDDLYRHGYLSVTAQPSDRELEFFDERQRLVLDEQ